MSSQSIFNTAPMSDSDDERYEQQLVKQREEAEARLREEEEQQRAEQRARKEVRAVEKRKQEKELKRRVEEERRQKKEVERQMKAEEERQRQKEADQQAAVVQMRRKNWLKKMNPEPLAFPPSEEEMNLIDLPSLMKRQQVWYLPKETPEQRREREETARELGIEPMGAGSPCERCANFSILCLPQDLP